MQNLNLNELFTESDWEEIEAASSFNQLSSMSRDDWQYALNECMRVYDGLIAGMYGRTDDDCNIEEWKEQMAEIIRKIREEVLPSLLPDIEQPAQQQPLATAETLGRMASMIRELASLIDDAHDVHIWDMDNDDHPEEGCEYCLAVEEANMLLKDLGLTDAKDPGPKQSISSYWILVITQPNGDQIKGIYEDYEEAQEKLYSYVKENWEYSAISEDMSLTGDREEDIALFFENWDEEYYIEDSPIFFKGGKAE